MESVLGDLSDLTCLQGIKDFLNRFGCSNIKADTFLENTDFRNNYLLNISIYELEHLNFVILVGVNARFDFPLLNLRFRKRFLKGGFNIYTVGQGINYLTFPVENFGNMRSMLTFIKGMSSLCKLLLSNKKSRIFLGKSNIKTFDFNSIYKLTNFCNKLLNREDLVCILENQTGLLNSYDLGLFSSINRIKSYYFDTKLYKLYLVLNNNNFLNEIQDKANKFIVYFDSHGYNSISKSNVILPTTTFVESEGLYVNLEGLAQIANVALPSVGDSRELKLILKALQLYLCIINGYQKDFSVSKIEDLIVTSTSR